MVLDDAQFNEQVVRVQKVVDYWWKALELDARGFVLKINYNREERHEEEDNQIWRTFMEIGTSWQYQHADMAVWIPECYHQSDEQIEEDVVHEFMHMLVNEMRADPKIGPKDEDSIDLHNHEERVVTSLARSLTHLRNYAGGRSPLEVGPPGPADSPDPNTPPPPSMPENHQERPLTEPHRMVPMPLPIVTNGDTSHDPPHGEEVLRSDDMRVVAAQE